MIRWSGCLQLNPELEVFCLRISSNRHQDPLANEKIDVAAVGLEPRSTPSCQVKTALFDSHLVLIRTLSFYYWASLSLNTFGTTGPWFLLTV